MSAKKRKKLAVAAGAGPSRRSCVSAAVPDMAEQPVGLAAFQRPSPSSQQVMGSRARRTRSGRSSGTGGSPSFFDLPVDEQQATHGWSPAALEEAGAHGLAATYRFRAPQHPGSYDLAVRFLGRRKDVAGQPTSQDWFERVERIERAPADGGDVALTARVLDVNRGTWRVLAEPQGGVSTKQFPRRVVETHSRFFPLAQGPRVTVWAWPALVALGVAAAVAIQFVLSERAGIHAWTVLLLSAAGVISGFVGGKVWYLVVHRRPLTDFVQSGACIQGFLLVALAALAGGAALLGLPARTVLDLTTPGIFLGVAIGRPGCFLTGCCAGRPTTSRWGLVSSDRRLTLRRVPVQLLEAGAGLAIGVVSLVIVLTVPMPISGSVFVAAVGAYTLVRQMLFPLRVDAHTRGGRVAASAASALAVAVAVSTLLL